MTFLNGVGSVLTTHPVVANNVDDRWELLGDRVSIPVGTRSIVYRFEASRTSGTTADAYLDEAFVFVLPEGVVAGQGAFGDQGLTAAPTRPSIALRSPDLYVDVLRDTPTEIRWNTFGNADELPITIELLQDTPAGSVLHTVISASTPDDGSYEWTPADDSIDYGTYGWRIQVSLVGDSAVLDRSTEVFAVPEETSTYYVNDQSLIHDEYTSASGSNRNTGKLPDRPKPYVNNVIRVYSLSAGETLYHDTGSYPSFEPVVIANAIGLGDDEGFTWTGPIGAGVAELWPAHPDETPNLVQLVDADSVTLEQLTLRDAGTGLLLSNNSLNFTGNGLSVTGHTLDGVRVEDNASGTELIGIVANSNARHGVYLLSPIDLFADSQVEENEGDGLHAVDQDGLVVRNNDLRANLNGVFLTTLPAASATIENNQVSLSLGHGIQALGDILVQRNAIHENAAIGIWGGDGASIEQNVVFFNSIGVQLSGNVANARLGKRESCLRKLAGWNSRVSFK